MLELPKCDPSVFVVESRLKEAHRLKQQDKFNVSFVEGVEIFRCLNLYKATIEL